MGVSGWIGVVGAMICIVRIGGITRSSEINSSLGTSSGDGDHGKV